MPTNRKLKTRNKERRVQKSLTGHLFFIWLFCEYAKDLTQSDFFPSFYDFFWQAAKNLVLNIQNDG